MMSRVCDMQKQIATFLRQNNLLTDVDHYASERPQCEVAGQRHSRNRHLRTHHRLRGKAACVPVDVEPDTCVSVVASLREEFAPRFAGLRQLAADFKLFTAPCDVPVDDAPAPCRWSWWSYRRRHSTTLLHCPCFRHIALSSRNFPKYIAHVQHIVAMCGDTYSTVANSSSPK